MSLTVSNAVANAANQFLPTHLVPAAFSDLTPPESSSATHRYEANKRLLAAALRLVGIPSIAISYQGSGDSGGVEDVAVSEGSNVDPRGLHVPFWATVWQPKGDPIVQIQQMSLLDACEHFSNLALTYFHLDGYENNDGGRGEVILRADGRCKVQRCEYVTEEQWSDHGDIDDDDTDRVEREHE